MKLIVGLGNPGKSYEASRHNAGFMALDALAGKHGIKWKRGWRFSAQIGKVSLLGRDLILAKPQTFMNRSGAAIAALARKKGIRPEEILVVFDDADLDCGRIRVRRKGGAGGHNGVASVIQALGSGDFPRIRIGVGPRPAGEELVEFVLSSMAPDEKRAVREAVERSVEAIECMVESGPETAMNRFNG